MSKTKTIMKESIIDGAFAVFRKYGYENLNARSLAREMNCSTQPIYVNFKDMDQVKKIARKLAAERYQEILGEAEKKYKKLTYSNYYLGIVKLAAYEPMLFKYYYIDHQELGKKAFNDYGRETFVELNKEYGLKGKAAGKVSKNLFNCVVAYGMLVTFGYTDFDETEALEAVKRYFVQSTEKYGFTE